MGNEKLKKYGYSEYFEKESYIYDKKNDQLIPARVTEVHREQYKIVSEFGENYAKLKGSIFYSNEDGIEYPAVGDFVLIWKNNCGDDVIHRVIKRKSVFSRMDNHYGKEQIVASNFDYVFIMTSLNHDFNIKRLERYLTVSYESGAKPVIILTKSDLCSNVEEYEDSIREIAFDVPVISVSSVTGEGVEGLHEYVKPQNTIVFLGSSGVGKSSLVNAIAGEEIMKVNGIREDDSKGRHTTTHRQLIMLNNGAMIIDTPGMRELGMWVVSDGLTEVFSEIEKLEGECKFRDCKHKSEPGCAIKRALKEGEISHDRWENYQKLKWEARRAQKKKDENMSSDQRRVNKRLQEKSFGKSQNKFRKELNKTRR